MGEYPNPIGQLGAHLNKTPKYGLTESLPSEKRAGDFFVVAYKAPGIVARSIGYVTHSKWTHAATYLGDGLIGEAHPNGYRIRNLSEYDNTSNTAWSNIPLTDEQRNTIVRNAHMLADMDIGYGWADIAAISLAAAGVHAEPVMRRLHRPDKMICSSAVAHLYRWADAPLTTRPEDADLVTPADLAVIIDAH